MIPSDLCQWPPWRSPSPFGGQTIRPQVIPGGGAVDISARRSARTKGCLVASNAKPSVEVNSATSDACVTNTSHNCHAQTDLNTMAAHQQRQKQRTWELSDARQIQTKRACHALPLESLELVPRGRCVWNTSLLLCTWQEQPEHLYKWEKARLTKAEANRQQDQILARGENISAHDRQRRPSCESCNR